MDLKNIYIRGFRVDEWPLLRAKRLEAIKENGSFFLFSYEVVETYDESHWRNLILQTDGKIFGLFDGLKIIGLTGVFRDRHDESGSSAEIGMSYIDPAYRGRGLSRLFYDVRLDWAKNCGFKCINAAHREGNIVSKRALISAGFKWIGNEEKLYGDKTTGMSHKYKLIL